MKRERMLQVVLVILGLLFLATIYFLYIDLWHAHWIVDKRNEIEPMFISVFVVLGPFLLVAARNPSAHRSLIAFTAWWCLAHAAVMAIETKQAWNHGIHRDFKDVVIFAVIGLILLALSPPGRERAQLDRNH